MLKKINAGVGLGATVLLMIHAIYCSVWMLSRCSIAKYADAFPRVLSAVMAVHVILSAVIMLTCRRGKRGEKDKKYLRLNIETYIQRGTGILMLLMLGLHIAGSFNHFQPKLLHAALHPVFFAVSLLHVSVSAGRALITLGVGGAKTVRAVNIAMHILCGATFVAGAIGFYLCLFVGVAR